MQDKAANHSLIYLAMHLVVQTLGWCLGGMPFHCISGRGNSRLKLAMSLRAVIYIAFSCTFFGLGHNNNFNIHCLGGKIMLETGQVLTLYVLWFVFAFALAAFVLKKNS